MAWRSSWTAAIFLAAIASLGMTDVASAVERKTLSKEDPTTNEEVTPELFLGDWQPLEWHTDYAEAMSQSDRQMKMLLIHFYDPDNPQQSERVEQDLAENLEVRERLERYVLVRLPIDATIQVHGKPLMLLDHKAYGDLQKGQGVIIIDYANPKSEHYGQVISALPFKNGKYYRYRGEHIPVLLDLPAGTLTQRTLVFAVRIHPEAPASTKGNKNSHLIAEAKQHSLYQADIGIQGHHHWDERFQRIGQKLPGGLMAQEVVAESWPNESLIDAAVDCVASWRQSPGHWGAVKRRQPLFGYDMRLGRNGIWYATGIFGNRH
ncbi:MAG TPA: hypothetical protein VGJ26_16825 [Pirellulales bacterium]